MSGGSLKKLGAESNGISGTDGCANAHPLNSTNNPRKHGFTDHLQCRTNLSQKRTAVLCYIYDQ
jgi:hypothetical protein